VASYEAWHRRARLSIPEPLISPNIRLAVDRYFSRLPEAVVGKRYGDSLFFAAPGWWRFIFRPYLTAIANLDLKPSSVLDVGCGDGLVTCFYAYLYPKAEVIALDLCGVCLVTTRTIARRLGLQNLSIVQADAVDAPAIFRGRTFNLVLARAFTAFRSRCSCGRSLGDPIDDVNRHEKTIKVVQAITQVLTPIKGRFISTEDWPGPAHLWCWASTMANAGLRVDWTLSQGVRTARRRWSMLVSQVAPASAGVSLTDVLAFLVSAEVQDTGRAPPVTGALAEALFNVLVTNGFVFGFQATRYDVLLRRELHSAGALLMSYDYTNGNERELRLWPRRLALHLRSQLEQEANDLRTQGWDVLRFIPRAEHPGDCEEPDTA
jgi:SAM-dependent methyltransferase